jgi:tetratricopeptide (TPR) repeat protein
MTMNLRSLILASVSGLFFMSPALASASVDPQVVSLLEHGQGKEAYLLLRSSFDAARADAQDWFLLAMTARAAGDLKVAEKAFAKVIVIAPASSARSKLELALLYYNQGNYAVARRLFLEVRAENPPPQVRQNIDRYLALMGEEAPQDDTLKFRVSAGITYDSNVNQATTKDTVTMFGLPFTLSDDAKAQDDFYATMRFEIDHLMRVGDRVDWQSGLSVTRREYFELNQYDSFTLEASTGPVFRLGEATILSLPASLELLKYDNRSELYSIVAGVAPQLRSQLSETAALNLGGNIAHKWFENNSDRDTWSFDGSSGLYFKLGQGSLRLGVNAGIDDSGIDTYSHWRAGASASLYQPLGEDLAGSLWASYLHSDYDEEEAAYTEARKDDRVSAGFDLRYALVDPGLDLILSGSFTHNGSNLDIYQYDQFQTTFTIAKPF